MNLNWMPLAPLVIALTFGCDDSGAGTPDPELDGGVDGPARVLADAAPPDVGCVPQEERCNGVDDNCDGNIDEGFDGLGGACRNEASPCPSTGTWVCAEDGAGTVCDAPDVMPEPELCDGVDNDCDTRVDEGFDFASDVDHCGGCERACTFDQASAACLEGVCELVACDDGFGDANRVPFDGCECVVNAAGETCNGLDDDCDGTLDEGLGLAEPCVAGVGACEVAGATVCDDAGGVVCDAVSGPPGVETCNGLDDDCDGAIDEDFDGDGDGAAFCADVECADCPAGAPCAALCARQDCDDADPTRFPGARDVCDDDIDQDCTGSDASCDGPTGRLTSIAVANGPNCRDFNGDGRPDNSLSLAALIANPQITNSIANDELNLFVAALGLSGARFDLGILVGSPVPGGYALDPGSLGPDGLPLMLFPGAQLVDGAFSAGPGQFNLNVPFNGVELAFIVNDTRVTGQLSFVGDDGINVEEGWITGYVTGMQVEQLLLLVGDAADIVRNLLMADVDTDGDRMPDAYSACLSYTARSTALIGFPPE